MVAERPKKKVRSYRLTETMVADMQRIALAVGCSTESEVAARAIWEFIERNKKKLKP